MKRLAALLLSAVLVAVPFIPFALAEGSHTVTTEYFEDGEYMVIGSSEDTEHEETATEQSFIGRLIQAIKRLINMLLGKSDYKTAECTRYVYYYDRNGNMLWSVYLDAAFSYDGKASSCTDAGVRYYIYDSDWTMLSAQADKSGATATAFFRVRQYKLGVVLKTVEKSISVTCDKNGILQ